VIQCQIGAPLSDQLKVLDLLPHAVLDYIRKRGLYR
jgi:hypothetical protein